MQQIQHMPVHGGMIWEAERSVSGGSILDFSSSINPVPPPPEILKGLREGFKLIYRYPDQHYSALKEAIASYHSIDPGNVVTGAGATEVIHMFASAMAHTGSSVILSSPTFSEYEFASKKAGFRVKHLKRSEDSLIDIRSILKIAGKGDVVYICNPNNPTGKLEIEGDTEKLIDAAVAKKFSVLLDESFMDLVAAGTNYTLVDTAVKSSSVFVVKSLTKVLGVPGLRVGYGIGGKSMADKISRFGITWGISVPCSMAAEMAMPVMKKHIRDSLEVIKKERQFLLDGIHPICGRTNVSGLANFIYVGTQQLNMSSRLLCKKFLERKILVRDCSSFRMAGSHHIRVAVRTHGENIKFLAALKNIAGK